MDQAASPPDPAPGRRTGEGRTPSGPARRPPPARRGGGLTIVLCVLVAGTFMVLSGVGLGTVGATVTGIGRGGAGGPCGLGDLGGNGGLGGRYGPFGRRRR
ncbi:PDZ domain-containing protein, partial [Streptomyces sp. NPDC001215]